MMGNALNDTFREWGKKNYWKRKEGKEKRKGKKNQTHFDLCPQNSMLGSSLCKNYQAKTSGKESHETAGNVAGLLFIFCL